MKAQLKVLSALILGGLVAFAPVVRAADANAEKKGDRKGPSMEERLATMEKELGLTADQKAKVQTLMENQQKAWRAAREQNQNLSQEERRAKMTENRKAFDAKMKEILKPEQYEKWLKTRPQRPGGPGGEKKGEGKGQKQE